MLGSNWKIFSIGIGIGVDFKNPKDWYRYWYRNFVLQDETAVSFETSRYRASMDFYSRKKKIAPVI